MPRRRELPFDPLRLPDLEETGHEVLYLSQFGGRYDAVVTALEALPLEPRRLLEMYFWERLTYRQIGVEMDWSHMKAVRRIRQAMELLREELKECV